MPFEKIVIITQKTQLQELLERFGTHGQARFYLEHMGASFDEYQAAHDAYMRAIESLEHALPAELRQQFVERGFLPNFSFGERDLLATLGRDGLVVNTAKYLGSQPILAFNPDRLRVDGILIPFDVGNAAQVIRNTIEGKYTLSAISMAKAELNDGQVLHAVNDLFIGQRTHLSARYRIRLGDVEEDHSSSGIIVSTGAGSTGWFRSIVTGASRVIEGIYDGGDLSAARTEYRFPWDADYLYFSVREPFVSNLSSADLVFGTIDAGARLELTSHMPQNGVIFSDGVEADYLAFNSGSIANITLADRKVQLITGV